MEPRRSARRDNLCTTEENLDPVRDGGSGDDEIQGGQKLVFLHDDSFWRHGALMRGSVQESGGVNGKLRQGIGTVDVRVVVEQLDTDKQCGHACNGLLSEIVGGVPDPGRVPEAWTA